MYERADNRRGLIVVWVALLMVPLMAFVAMAVDLGLVMTARSQCQLAADSAAMAGVRTLHGDPDNSYGYSDVTPNARAAAAANQVLGTTVQPAQVSVQIGRYTYDSGNQRFNAEIPGPSSEPWTLVRTTVTYAGTHAFAQVLGMNLYNTSATAAAVHRPRDVCVVVDLSGSMRFDTLVGIPPNPGATGRNLGSMNPETVYPLFGHYSDIGAAALENSATLTDWSSSSTSMAANFTVDTVGGPAVVKDFYQDTAGQIPTVKAFSPAPDGYATAPGGDVPLRGNWNDDNEAYATTVSDIINQPLKHTGWEANGYEECSNVTGFEGYSVGPRYWGKTFWIWPPDARQNKDWRRKFFWIPGTNNPVDDNTRLYDSNGKWKAPGPTTYVINYDAILDWIKNTGPNPFPPRLRAGGILYYDAIPDSFTTIDVSATLPTFPDNPSTQTERNERFWKDYIDHVLGLLQGNKHPKASSGLSYANHNNRMGYGDDYNWGTIQITTKPSEQYMNYSDNPQRPKTHFWFGPMTMVDFLGDYSADQYGRFWWPGTAHEAPTWQCKLGIQAALQDMKQNHPNDHVSLIFFSAPKNSASDDDTRKRFNRPQAPMGQDYSRMINSLWYPLSYIETGQEINPYETDPAKLIQNVPTANGSTCYPMGLMLAYNQFSSDPGLRTYNTTPGAPYGDAGGLGRKGASRLIIFESDGLVNRKALAGFTDNGAYNSYYNCRWPNEFPGDSGSDATTQAYDVLNRICALDTDVNPGYSTTRKPVVVHCLAFGTLFEPTSSNTNKQQALDVLQMMQYIGGKAGGEQPTPSDPLPGYKQIIGTADQRIDKLQEAIRRIMQDGVQVTLIE